MRIELEISDENEGTQSPYWLIIDPKQNLKRGLDGIYNIASMITGPFFSRREAGIVLRNRSHHYSDKAIVYCHSGCDTIQYYNKVQF